MTLIVILGILALVVVVGYVLSGPTPQIEAQAQEVVSDVEEAANDAVVLVEEAATEVVAKVKRTRKPKTTAA